MTVTATAMTTMATAEIDGDGVAAAAAWRRFSAVFACSSPMLLLHQAATFGAD